MDLSFRCPKPVAKERVYGLGSTGWWVAGQVKKNGFFCLPSHLPPLLLAGRSACTASALKRSTWWRWCPWRWRRPSANSCLTSRGTRPRMTTQAVPWRSMPGSRRGWSLNRYRSWWEGSCGVAFYLCLTRPSSFQFRRESWLCWFRQVGLHGMKMSGAPVGNQEEKWNWALGGPWLIHSVLPFLTVTKRLSRNV